ncbi:Innexin-3 [Trichinella spiralis]|uniref:Innexin n=1 Tax=Trichinella spiralis TaxID=6334 RepID=A0A0V1BR02_TRISP|nr:Innexin-3 [Trichinella spiralis]
MNAHKPTVDNDVYSPWIGQAIECWMPEEFKYAWEEITEKFCYIQDIYWFPLNDTIPERSERGHNHISYYQSVPFIPGVQELFFIQFVSALFVACLQLSLW